MIEIVARVQGGYAHAALTGRGVDKLIVPYVHSDVTDGIDAVGEEHEVAGAQVALFNGDAVVVILARCAAHKRITVLPVEVVDKSGAVKAAGRRATVNVGSAEILLCGCDDLIRDRVRGAQAHIVCAHVAAQSVIADGVPIAALAADLDLNTLVIVADGGIARTRAAAHTHAVAGDDADVIKLLGRSGHALAYLHIVRTHIAVLAVDADLVPIAALAAYLDARALIESAEACKVGARAHSEAHVAAADGAGLGASVAFIGGDAEILGGYVAGFAVVADLIPILHRAEDGHGDAV